MEITLQWFWLIGFSVMVLEAFLGYKWFHSGFNKKWGLALLATLIIVFFSGRMIKFEQVTAEEFSTQQRMSIESNKILPQKVKDGSFKQSVKDTKPISVDFVKDN
jgi:thiol:disulfide interchange protein